MPVSGYLVSPQPTLKLGWWMTWTQNVSRVRPCSPGMPDTCWTGGPRRRQHKKRQPAVSQPVATPLQDPATQGPITQGPVTRSRARLIRQERNM